MRYDENAIARRVTSLSLSRRVLFACGCAERLMPAYRWYCDRAGLGDFFVVRQALDTAWSGGLQEGVPAPPEIPRIRAQVEALVPSDDDEENFPGSAVAQNAVAGVAYALRTWETADPQEAVWSARQLYEAADVIVQQGAPVQTYVGDIDSEAPVQLVLQGMHAALGHESDASDMLTSAKADGEEFLKFLTRVD